MTPDARASLDVPVSFAEVGTAEIAYRTASDSAA